MILIFEFFLKLSLLFSLPFSIFILGCGIKDTSENEKKADPKQALESQFDVGIQKPVGDELKIETEKLNDSEFKIVVSNISSKKVYCYYNTSLNGDRVSFHYFPRKRNEDNGKFERYMDGPDNIPVPAPIKPNQSFEFVFSVAKKGEYQLIIPYFVDENVAKILMKKNPFELTDSEKEKVDLAKGKIISPVMLATIK